MANPTAVAEDIKKAIMEVAGDYDFIDLLEAVDSLAAMALDQGRQVAWLDPVKSREAFTDWFDKRDGIQNAWTAWQAAIAFSQRKSARAE